MYPTPESSNSFIWWYDSFDFSVKSAFCRLGSLVNPDFKPDIELSKDLKCVWKSKVPSNVQVFAQILLW